MACFKPLQAWQSRVDGSVRFVERGDCEPLSLPCGQCVGCRLERSRQWAIRCIHEAQLHEKNCFITLTYKDAPSSLEYRDFQLFMKRLRKRFGAVRFYMCGEYGERNGRPHYHACLFGFDFPDKLWLKKGNGYELYTSAILDDLWQFGLCSVGSVSFESAAYVARYIMKKVTGVAADVHYIDGDGVVRVPEFTHMSLKPGIGAGWYERFRDDIYPDGKVVVRGRLVKPPRFYDRLEKRFENDDFERMQFERYKFSRLQAKDNTDERLAVREKVVDARVKLFSKEL